MKKVAILLAAMMLLVSVSGQAMAYFEVGELVRVVYQAGGTGNEVATDLGPASSWTTAGAVTNTTFNANNFLLSQFPGAAMADLQVVYFSKINSGSIWISGPENGQNNNAGHQNGTTTAMTQVINAYKAAASSSAQAVVASSTLNSYWKKLDQSGVGIGGFSTFADGGEANEANLANLASPGGYVDLYLYYYPSATANQAGSGVNVARIRTFADGHTEVTASQQPAEYDLSLSNTGNGLVKIDETPEALPWSGQYQSGTNVKIEAVPDTGWSFSGWTGGYTGTTNPATITMSSDKAITANFTQNQPTNYTLSLSKAGNGSVTVNGTPHTLPWSGPFQSGASVQVQAVPDSGWSFTNWTVDQTGSTNPVSITMTANKSVTATFTQNCNLTLTLNTSPSGGGSITKNPNKATYCSGEQVTLTANPTSSYTFSSWSGDQTGSTNPATITMTANKSVTATFTQSQNCNLTLTLNTSPSGGGSIARNPEKTTYCSGEQVTLTANPASGYTFGSWSGDQTGSTNPAVVNMNSNKSVTATFTQSQNCNLTLTLNSSPSGGGSIAKSPDKATYCSGEQVTITANPASGYAFSSWSGDQTGSTNPAVITMTANKSVAATFTQSQNCNLTLTLSSSPSGGGSIARIPDKATYCSGEQVTLTANPASGYTFGSWSGDQTGSTNPAVITMTANKSVTATFTQSQNCNLTLTLSSDPSGGGSITKNPDKATYCSGDQVTITATPAAGYAFSSWSGDQTGSTNPVTVTMTANKSVSASFTQSQNCNLTLTLGSDPSGGGSIAKSPDKTTYCSGDQVILTANPSSGYSFSLWSGDQTGSTNPATITMNANKNITASFQNCNLTLTLGSDPSGSGTIARSLDKTTYCPGDQVTITATPAAGYAFSSWSGDQTGSTNPATITMDANKSVTANFTCNLTLTINANPADGGTIVKSLDKTTYCPGDQVTLTATPAVGYAFSSWSGDQTGSTNPATITMDASKSITADFTCNLTLTINIKPTGSGTVARDLDKTTYCPGDQVTLTPTPASGYEFTSWSGDQTGSDNSVVINMTASMNITADFNLLNGPNLTGSWNTISQSCRGNRCTITGKFKLQNTGNESARSSSVIFYLSDDDTWDANDSQLKKMKMPALKAGKSRIISFSYGFRDTATDKYIIAVIHPDNTVAEIFETDNIISYGPIPRANLAGLWESVVQKCTGANCTLKGSFSVENNGYQDASSFSVTFYLSDNSTYEAEDEALKKVSIGILKPGTRKVVSFNKILKGRTASDKFVIAVIDSDSSVYETNEGDNIVFYGPVE